MLDDGDDLRHERRYLLVVDWLALDKSRMKAAEFAARNELESIVKDYIAAGWEEAVGSSGTIRAIGDLLAQAGFADGGITRYGLDGLRTQLIKLGCASPESLPGLRADRAPVLPGGLAILLAVFDAFGIEKMNVSEGALRQGVLYDLLGRFEHRDMREVTVRQFMRRYHVDAAQADRVRTFALRLYDSFIPPTEDDADRQMLDWAARVSEVGLSIAHAQYHKHSAYVLSNADMPGFSHMEQQRLARVVLAHRGKLGKMHDAGLEGSDWLLVFALRLATLLMRSRTDAVLPPLLVAGDAGGFTIEVPQSWLEDNPLTGSAFETESDIWKAVGMSLRISAVSDKRAAQIAKTA